MPLFHSQRDFDQSRDPLISSPNTMRRADFFREARGKLLAEALPTDPSRRVARREHKENYNGNLIKVMPVFCFPAQRR
jgi:hypothetical protein